MDRDLAGWLDTQIDVGSTAPSTTIVPSGTTDVKRALGLLEQMAGTSLLASVQLAPGPVIGEGGMGIVRQAEQLSLGRTVAIKTLKPTMRTHVAARDLLREAWVTGSLEHPNVVPVHHLGVDDAGMPALVLKRIEGVEWSKLIRDADEVKRRFGATDLLSWNLSILMQALNAIRFAHSRGILHRDLKPGNVMVGDFGEVYLLDWGIAVSLRDDGTGRLPLAKDATSVAGTPCYMAPEMLDREGATPLSERTDVYLAGAVLFEIVAGHPPHEGATALEVLTRVLDSDPHVPDDVPPELADIIGRAMQRDAAARFESAEALRLALQAYLEHRGSDQLAARARLRLDELAAVLARPPDDRMRHREEVYRLFGACRFGFHEALAVWHDNATARAGLRRATVAVAEYELATGDAHTAVTLLSELDEPPALLEQARAAAARQAERKQALERLDYTHDLAVGRRQRGKLGVTVGVIFTLAPLVMELVPRASVISHWTLAGWALVFALLTAAWIWFGRAQLATTLVNRRLLGGLLFMFLAQALLCSCAYMLGVSLEKTKVLLLFLYFVIAGLGTMTVDLGMAPSAVGYAAGFAFSSRYPALQPYAMACANGVFTLNVLFGWLLRDRDARST